MGVKKNQGMSLLEKITDIYIFVMILLFPLLVDSTGFFKILECKYRYFVGISSIYIIMTTIIWIFFLLKKSPSLNKKKLSIIQYFSILFLILNVIACFASPYFKNYNLFVGVGRKEGLITSVLYILSFLYVSYFGKFKKKYILMFSISSILINLIAILQFIGFNPFYMYQDGIGTHNVSFMATIGNIDSISALYTILLTVSVGTFLLIDDNKIWEDILHILSILMGSFILEIIDVSSGKLAFLCVLFITFPFIFRNNVRLSKFLICVAVILLSITVNMILNVEYHYDLGRLGFYFQLNGMILFFIFLIIILFLLAKYVSSLNFSVKEIKKSVKNYYKGFIALGVVSAIGIYFVPFKSGFLYEIHELLHFNFNDSFGTYRIFLWKRTLPLIKDYLFFGSGPDTFALRFMPLYSEDIANIGPFTINDTAANIYLTMLVNLGVIGTFSYIGFLISQIVLGVKRRTSCSVVLLLAILCYMIQSFFNLSVVIVSPIFWILMGIHHLSIEEKGVKI